ncbi:MAG: GIY-YIG nuclease family protein [Acidobacteria bacterium]|nr:GIY-YIG nuclease family protein [Acidobacteriota bacterium]MCB9399667.1 GIY-YIG nuclease family protein [Acidobacteriota bacterium]
MDRKQALRQYKETALPAGIFQVKNLKTGQVLIGTSPNLTGMLNRQRFELGMNGHRNKALQADWNASGESAFEIGVLDLLEGQERSEAEQRAELKLLLEMWREKLTASGATFY